MSSWRANVVQQVFRVNRKVNNWRVQETQQVWRLNRTINNWRVQQTQQVIRVNRKIYNWRVQNSEKVVYRVRFHTPSTVAVGFPTGGILGQVLTKQSADNFDADWENPVTGVTDHLLLSNIGTKTHAEIDSHIADVTSNPHNVGWTVETFTAGANISALQVLKCEADDMVYAASADTAGDATKIVGIAITAGSASDPIRVVTGGSLRDAVWAWDITKGIFLGLNGALVQAIPGTAVFTMYMGTPVGTEGMTVRMDWPIFVG